MNKKHTGFGIWLKQTRQRRGLSMRALGENIDVSHVHISNMEAGGSYSREMVIRLVEGLLPENPSEEDRTELLDEALRAAYPRPGDDTVYDEHEVIDYLRGMPPAKLDRASRLLKAAFDEDDAEDNAGNIGKRAE